MSDSAFPDALPKDHRLHWYVIERVLGQGGFGITYLAHDTNLDQRVAIKEYLPVDVATRRPDATVRARTADQEQRYSGGLERFIREARTLARFDHPNIVRVLSVFEFNHTAYMVMRFEDGETLAALLERRHALGEAELMRTLLPILGGLELVHNAGFIHRDIKPDNIHIRSDGTPVLLDFGSARYALGHSRTVTILVAPGYAPFEQYYSSGENQGPWTDLYGLAATCYRAIAGRPPLDAIARSKGILGSTKEMLVPATAVGNSRYSERLLKAIDHALAFAETERPQSIAEWRRELLGDAPAAAAPAAPTTVATRSAPPQEVVSPPATPITQPPAASIRGPVIWSSAGAVAVLLAATGLVWLQRAAPPAAPAATAALQNDDRIAALERKLDEERKRQSEDILQQRQQIAALEKQLEEARKKAAPPAEPPKPPMAEAPKRAPAEPPKRREPSKPKMPQPSLAAARPAPPLVSPPAPPAQVSPPAAPPAAPVEAPKPPPPPSRSELLAKADAAIAKRSYSDALSILKPLAERGDAQAQLKLGGMYFEGHGVKRDPEEAVRLYEGAAGRGSGEAAFRLGGLYAEGNSVKQSDYQAYLWYSFAANLGHDVAKRQQLRVGPRLQPKEIEQAGKLVENMLGSIKER